MFHNFLIGPEINICDQPVSQTERYLNPSDIYIMPGYQIEVNVYGLDSPNSLLFNDKGEMIVSESGMMSGNPRILRIISGSVEVIAEKFTIPITGIGYHNGVIYVSHRGNISRILSDGTIQNIIMGLPSNGDHHTSPVDIGPDRKLYFGQGTVTNSGVVGNDNKWLTESPLLCDYVGDYIMLNGQNFTTNNILTDLQTGENTMTGAFSPYGSMNQPYEVRKGYIKASGSILRANLDGTNIEQFAWGFRNPNNLRFDNSGRMFVSNNGSKNIGSRPIANAPDEFYYVLPNLWYGWPDYCGGEPVTLPRYRPEGGVQPEFLFKNPPNNPPVPYVNFPTNANIRGFDFNYYEQFGPYGEVYIAEQGATEYPRGAYSASYASSGHRISRISMSARTINTFAINKSGFPASISREGGFEGPSDIRFGPDGAMYILDSGLRAADGSNAYLPNTGVIWKVTRVS